MVDNLEYNSTREKLIIPEYGRNIQKMVEFCCTIENRDERNANARAIISAMIQVQGYKTEPNIEHLHKLWDHLFMISEFKLDIDAPFEIPTQLENREFNPEKPTYNTAIVNNYRSYGHNVQALVDMVCEIQDQEIKNSLTLNLANYLKKSYLQWNRDSVTDDVIINQLKAVSKGRLVLSETQPLMTTAEILSLYHNDSYMQNRYSSKKSDPKTKKMMMNGRKKNNIKKNNKPS